MKRRCLRHKLPPSLKIIKKQLKKIDGKHILLESLNEEELKLITAIRKKTADKNKNNVTRTEAYLHYYRNNPEIHWALLGHMVSRNGGWNMTDLKGDLLTKLLTEKEQRNFFSFLERGNWLIFQDVYPQLLLYEESQIRQKKLFYLLPIFKVSAFMEVIWNFYYENKDDYLLAMALVVNEQNYLEKRVIQNSHYKTSVLETLKFKLQDILSLNQVLFPYIDGTNIKITGQTIHHFAALHERILLGKRLYELLFNDHMLPKMLKWSYKQRHTGSRKDYWPQLYNTTNDSIPGKTYKRRTKNCSLITGSHRIYSPSLSQAWNNVKHKKAAEDDWYSYSDWKVVHYLKSSKINVNGEISNEYCETLEKIELAILAKEGLFKK
ncbi:DUF2515 family protein [Evansella halocellulosilytica]|uniref:DUF2515 family protein n=1 Tax=Evansella halocellulosilytica TaxID=2011013 RepID=UPI000BB7A250|nr:DUF2515 family protein [Evansella halocellulosilytica]